MGGSLDPDVGEAGGSLNLSVFLPPGDEVFLICHCSLPESHCCGDIVLREDQVPFVIQAGP